MEILNCTPHKIKVAIKPEFEGDETWFKTFEPCGIIPRVKTIEKDDPVIGVIPTIIIQRGEVEGLPSPVDGTFLIVSGMVLSATERVDVIAPDTGPTCIRKDGHIVAVRNFISK